MEQVGMDEAVAAEIERRVREEVQRARAEWEAEQAQADAERERVAGMSDDERERYALSRREAALDERERMIAERELRAMALEQLSPRGLPRELAEALDHTFLVEEGSLAPATLAALEAEGFSLFIVPFRTTAENLARYFGDCLVEQGLPVSQVEMYETPNNCAVYRPQ